VDIAIECSILLILYNTSRLISMKFYNTSILEDFKCWPNMGRWCKNAIQHLINFGGNCWLVAVLHLKEKLMKWNVDWLDLSLPWRFDVSSVEVCKCVTSLWVWQPENGHKYWGEAGSEKLSFWWKQFCMDAKAKEAHLFTCFSLDCWNVWDWVSWSYLLLQCLLPLILMMERRMLRSSLSTWDLW